MDKLIVEGPTKLTGIVKVSRAKNSVLPLMTATLLTDKPITLKELHALRDVGTMKRLLAGMGVVLKERDQECTFNAADLTSYEASYELVKTMRASILVLGPLLARFGQAKVSLPGGCAIGSRPIDIHLEGLKKMGAQIEIVGGYVEAKTSKLQGAHYLMPFPSVGATENLMMAASLAQGETVLENIAREPEIEDLQNLLNKMGAKIEGAGTSTLRVQGVDALQAAEHLPIGDRIEAITYLIAALMTSSALTVEGIRKCDVSSALSLLEEMGASYDELDSGIHMRACHELKGCVIDTAPFPGFPTDAQAQLMSLCLIAQSPSVITESIFENRFMHVPELKRLGGEIKLRGRSAYIQGRSKLIGAPVMCTDLRASAALVLAGLKAQGRTEISRVYHLDRGYEKIGEKLGSLGAKVTRISE